MNISTSTREMNQMNGLAVTQVFIAYSFFMVISILSNILQSHFRKMGDNSHGKKADMLSFPQFCYL